MRSSEEKNAYYIIEISTPLGVKYLFNARTFVSYNGYATKYASLASAQRVARKVKAMGFDLEIKRESTPQNEKNLEES